MVSGKYSRISAEDWFYPASKRADTVNNFGAIRSIDRVYMGGRELNEDCYVPGSNHSGTDSSGNGCTGHCTLLHSTRVRGGRRAPHAPASKKNIITQQEYDQAVQEEEQAKAVEEQRLKQAMALTKSGLQFKIGGFAEFDFIDDNTHSFPEIIENKPVLHSNTLAGANSQFVMSPRNSRITFDVRAPKRDGIKSRYFARSIFSETNRRSGPPASRSSRR